MLAVFIYSVEAQGMTTMKKGGAARGQAWDRGEEGKEVLEKEMLSHSNTQKGQIRIEKILHYFIYSTLPVIHDNQSPKT